MQDQLNRIEAKLDSHAEKSVERHIKMNEKINKIDKRVTLSETKQKIYIGIACAVFAVLPKILAAVFP